MHYIRGNIRKCTLLWACTTTDVATLWNQQVKIDRTIPNNKLYIIIHNNKKGTYIHIHGSIIRTSWTECGIRTERNELPCAIKSKEYVTKLHTLSKNMTNNKDKIISTQKFKATYTLQYSETSKICDFKLSTHPECCMLSSG